MVRLPPQAWMCVTALLLGCATPAVPLLSTGPDTVQIQRNGAWHDRISSDESAQDCATFLLSSADVRDFLTRARPVSERTYAHELDASRCVASGSARFFPGVTGQWQIDRERRGLLTLSDGRTLYLHCGACKAAAFDVR